MKYLKKLLIFCIALCILFQNSILLQAMEIEKTISIALQEDYLQCGFYFSFEDPGEYLPSVVVIAPGGKEYPASVDPATGEYKSTLRNVKAGEYQVVVKKEISDSQFSEFFPFQSSEESSDLSSVDEDQLAETFIGKVTVSVKAETETIEAVTDDLRLAKEISGLQYYFKDDCLVVSWEDETVGNVNITVVNSKTLQIIEHKMVTEQYYEIPISPGIEEILLTVTPAVSENVAGAGDEYVVKVHNYPKGNVSFEPLEYTNKDTIRAVVTLEEEYSLLYENNGAVVGSTEVLPAGTHEVEIPTQIGDNAVKVYIVDKKNNMRSTSISVIKDITPPVIKISNDINGIFTKEESITFSGIVEDYELLSFRNEKVSVDWDGAFEVTASLKEGKNELVLIAVDKAGNEAIYKATVETPFQEPVVIPWDLIITVLIIILLLIAFIVIKKKQLFSFSQKKQVRKEKNRLHINGFRLKGQAKQSDYVCLAINVIVYAILIFGVFQFSIVQSSSMAPSVNEQEFVITNRLAYKLKVPRRGDIITFEDAQSGRVQLKRIVGLPGDIISFSNGFLFVNGYMCDESAYLDKDIESNSNQIFTVPEDSYFVLGDNREQSYDSRYWDDPYVKRSDIDGKLFIHLDFAGFF